MITHATIISLLMVLTSLVKTYGQDIALNNGYYIDQGQLLPSVETTFPEKSTIVQTALKEFLSSTYDMDLNSADLGKRGKYLYTENALIPALEQREVDVFIKFKDMPNTDGTLMHFSVRQHDDDYVDKWYDSNTYNDMRNMVLGFIHYHYPEYYEAEVVSHQETIASISKNASQIESEIADTRAAIDTRYDQIRVLSRKLVDMRKQMMALEMQMQNELKALESDQTIYLNIK
ncbi:MAG: hypothetical protein AAF738_01540 [Bacteroidota bacterium]